MKLLILLFLIFFLVQDVSISRLNLSTTLFIYGVRWFFGESFSYSEHLDKQKSYDDLILMFNTYEVNQDLSFHLQTQKQVFQCTSKRVTISIRENLHSQFNSQASPKGTIFTTYIHKCSIRFEERTFLQKNKQFDYSIAIKDDTTKNIVYAGTLRSPLFEEQDVKAIVVGDWGKITKGSPYYDFLESIDYCLTERISKEDPNFLIILGDIGYDMEGDTYIDFLLYLQPYSSRLVILFTPGNHETSKHPDIYPLVMESFYSPYWAKFYGYFDMVMLGKYAFVGYNPDSLFRKSLFSLLFENLYKNHFDLFETQFTPNMKQTLAAQYTVISISHYPIFCSEDDKHNNCSYHLSSQLKYLNLLQDLKTDLVLGAHLHYYQRSKPICDSEGFIFKSPSKQTSQRDTYLGKTCAIHIVEGSAGNNYFIQTYDQFPLKKFAKKYVTNTGFGVITLYKPNSDQTINYRHFSTVNKCTKADEFSIEANFPSTGFWKFLFNSTGSYVFLLILITVILHQIYCYLNNRKKAAEYKEHRAATTMELQFDSAYR